MKNYIPSIWLHQTLTINSSLFVLLLQKFTFLEASAVRKNLDKVHRTTQTLQDSQPK